MTQQKSINLENDFWAEAVGLKREPGESDESLVQRINIAFGFTPESFYVATH